MLAWPRVRGARARSPRARRSGGRSMRADRRDRHGGAELVECITPRPRVSRTLEPRGRPARHRPSNRGSRVRAPSDRLSRSSAALRVDTAPTRRRRATWTRKTRRCAGSATCAPPSRAHHQRRWVGRAANGYERTVRVRGRRAASRPRGEPSWRRTYRAARHPAGATRWRRICRGVSASGTWDRCGVCLSPCQRTPQSQIGQHGTVVWKYMTQNTFRLS
jgi:hypothetical protein